jgi:hypothetical protein
MTNLPVPVPAQESPGNLITGALWNAQVFNGLTFTLNPPCFAGTQTSVQSVANSTTTVITLDTTTVDTYGGHSNTVNPGRYVAQVPGWYLVAGVVNWATNATNGRATWLRLNGSNLPGGFGMSQGSAGAGSNFTTSSALAVVQMNGTGDYVDMACAQYSGGSLSTSSTTGQTSALTVVWLHA